MVSAAYYVAFGPHGPRKPINPPGTVPKIIGSVLGLLALSGALYSAIRATGTSISYLSGRCLPSDASCVNPFD